jgi:hypothetical protein
MAVQARLADHLGLREGTVRKSIGGAYRAKAQAPEQPHLDWSQDAREHAW